MDGPGPMPQQPQQPPNDLDAIYELIVGNTLSAFFWVFCIGGPMALAWWLYKNSRVARGWKKTAWVAGAGFLVIYVGAWTLFFVYGLSRKINALKGPVDRVVASVPLIGGWLTRTLGRQILPAPQLWHALLAFLLGAAGYAVWRRRRRASSTPVPPLEGRPLDAPAPENPVGQAAPTAEAERIPAAPSTPNVPIPAPERPARLCEAFGLKWEFKHGNWTPLCPLCHRGMGIMDVQREGMWVATGGRHADSKVIRSGL